MIRKVIPRERTAIEAESGAAKFMVRAYANLVDAIIERLGHEEGRKLAYDAYHKFVYEMCKPEWEEMRSEVPPNASEYLKWHIADPMLAYDIDVIEDTPDSVRLRYHTCPWATQFIDANNVDVGLMFCEVDYDMIKDFNEITGANLVFERTKTLMEGCDQCNHHIFVRK